MKKIFRSVLIDFLQHASFLNEAQRLRGRVYLHDGAIEAHQLSAGGRFEHPQDHTSWHLLITNSAGQVAGCMRYSPADEAKFHHLDIARSALASCDKWGVRLRKAVEAKKADAQRRELNYAEVGGWALTEEARGSSQALRMAVTIFALAELLGGALMTATTTTRHRSSTILKKFGGYRLVSDGLELPPYYDPQYKCEMEILGFDSHFPNPKYKVWVEECRRHLADLTVICAESLYPGMEFLGAPAAGPVSTLRDQPLTLKAIR